MNNKNWTIINYITAAIIGAVLGTLCWSALFGWFSEPTPNVRVRVDTTAAQMEVKSVGHEFYSAFAD